MMPLSLVTEEISLSVQATETTTNTGKVYDLSLIHIFKLKMNFIMTKFMWIRPMKNNEIDEKFDSL